MLRAVRLRRAAILEQRLGRLEDACTELAKLLEETPDNPGALRYVVMMMALYMHLGPFSKRVIGEIDRRIAELDDMPPVRATALEQALPPATV